MICLNLPPKIIDGFMSQGGDPEGTGMGRPMTIKGRILCQRCGK